ncbi:NADH-quinone oxidoreductase subunit NuoE family protein [Desulfolucanica intricata]|uniref:NADH-quinone oxidoreductase subunit NuoE family protein n=1 Tax=Desulfolucanica intricata TaxID=1285191 RepID=UPI00082B6D20|nr:NAD(P)H-dependent oxidoreductase subunit E [Desulfolucanica intricata]
MAKNCQCHSQISEELLSQIDKIIESSLDQPGNLIQVLHRAQELVGYLPREVQIRVAEGLNIPLANVYGVVSFYSFFNVHPKGKHKINVCAGTACYVKGAKQLLENIQEQLDVKPGGTTQDGQFSLGMVRCVGACGLGPVVTVDEDVHAQVHPGKIPSILSKYSKEQQ